MPLSGATILTIGRPGWFDRREIQVADVAASWRMSTPGRLSAFIPAPECWLLGIGPDEWEGRWVRWDHPTMGTWSGVVEDTNGDEGESAIELSCTQAHVLLKGYRTPRTYRQQMGPAGALVMRAISDAGAEQILWLGSAQADADGPLFDYEWKGDDLFQIVTSLARSSNHEWRVVLQDDWTFALQFRAKLGRDKRARVLLASGYHIGNGNLVGSVANLRNDVLAVSAESDWQEAPGAIAVDPESIARYGRRQTMKRYDGLTRQSTLYARAKEELETLSDLARPITLRVPDTEPQLAEIEEGDRILIWSAVRNAHLGFRVTSRSVNTSSGVATLTGDGETYP